FLFLTYLFFYRATKNNLDFTLPIIFFFYYIFLRIFISNDISVPQKIIGFVVPIILCGHYILAVLQYFALIPNFHSYFPVGSTFGNPDMLGAYISVLLPFCFARSKMKILHFLLLSFGIILLLIIQARTALLSTGITFIIYIFIEKKISLKQFLLSSIGSFMGLILLILWNPTSVSGRFFIWIVSGKMLIEKPQGWGLYAFQKDYMISQIEFIENFPLLASRFNIDIVYSPFNEFLNVGGRLGIIGLILYILFIGSILIIGYKEKSIFIYPLIAFIIISLFYFSFKITPLIVMILLFSVLAINKSQYSTVAIIKKNNKAIGILFIMLFMAILMALNYNSYDTWKKAIITRKDINLSDSLFLKSYKTLSGNGMFLYSYSDFYTVKEIFLIV
ncbi:MAG: hypothetical protein LIO79_02040, partial [Rikenellaceae bacterium]|nr:hypothetical protein [Rikenellaceae bacterium]